MADVTESTLTRISLVALPESTPAALYGLYEVLEGVGVHWPTLTGSGDPTPRFEVRIVSEDGLPMDSAIGTPIRPHAAIADVESTDALIIADLALTHDFDPTGRWPVMAAWVRGQYDRGAIVCSVCTGAVLLARAGVLDGLEATSHWSACDLLGRWFPSVKLRPERILVPAGQEHRIITSGGASSWEDLALYLIARFCGRNEAIQTAKVFLFGDRSEGQLPYAAMSRPRRIDDAVIADCQTWLAMHCHTETPLAGMIGRSGLAERTFSRRFRAATGQSPMDYVQTLRIEEAKQMLETTDDPSDAIAASLGYEDPTFFRRLFKKHTGITPGRYRQRFRSLVAS